MATLVIRDGALRPCGVSLLQAKCCKVVLRSTCARAPRACAGLCLCMRCAHVHGRRRALSTRAWGAQGTLFGGAAE
eukprot:6068176-Alexandrium_andersonii.AAC.1